MPTHLDILTSAPCAKHMLSLPCAQHPARFAGIRAHEISSACA